MTYNYVVVVRSISHMEAPYTSDSLGQLPSGGWRHRLSSASRFWEPRRVIYNLVLTAVVAVWVIFTWPHFRPAINLTFLLLLIVLAALANVCYSAAYFVELTIRASVSSVNLNRQRWALWLLGMSFAVVLENYWIVDEIYPFVR
jgi:hypothetical protein